MKKILLSLFLSLLFCQTVSATDYCADSNSKGAWYFDEASGSPQDCTSNNNDGTISGTVTQNVSGQFNKAVQFTQQNNAQINSGSAASLDNLATMSIVVWFDIDGAGSASGHSANGVIVSKGGRTKLLQCNGATNFRFTHEWEEPAASRGIWDSNTAPLSTSAGYQHVAVTFNNSSASNNPVFYVNGSSVTFGESSSPSGSGARLDASGNFLIGLDNVDTGELNGKLDELLYYNGILTSTQINDIKDNGLTAAAAARRAGLAS